MILAAPEADNSGVWKPRPWLSHHRLDASEELVKVLPSLAREDRPQMVESLMAAGAHPDGPGRNGLPLRHAVTKVDLALLKQLLAHGADPNARIISDRHEVPFDRQREPHNNVETVLQWAISRSGIKTRQLDGARSLEVMLHLICAGADPRATSRFGMSCLVLAKAEASSCSTSVSGRLIPLAIGMPLHVAIELKKPELCLSLLAAGADPEAKNPRRQTAWRAAQLTAPDCAAAMQAWKSQQLMREITAKNDRTREP